MLNKITFAAAMLLSLVAAPAFSDDEVVDCFFEANANLPDCTKVVAMPPRIVAAMGYSDCEPCNDDITVVFSASELCDD